VRRRRSPELCGGCGEAEGGGFAGGVVRAEGGLHCGGGGAWGRGGCGEAR